MATRFDYGLPRQLDSALAYPRLRRPLQLQSGQPFALEISKLRMGGF